MSRRDRFVRVVRDAISLQACIAMTRAQRLTRAALWLVLGIAMAIAGVEYERRHYPAQVHVLTPNVERAVEGMTIYRLRFEHRGVESACWATIYTDARTWSVTC